MIQEWFGDCACWTGVLDTKFNLLPENQEWINLEMPFLYDGKLKTFWDKYKSQLTETEVLDLF